MGAPYQQKMYYFRRQLNRTDIHGHFQILTILKILVTYVANINYNMYLLFTSLINHSVRVLLPEKKYVMILQSGKYMCKHMKITVLINVKQSVATMFQL